MPFRLLCDAIPFCYGPAAALETLIRFLEDSTKLSFEIEVLASGSTREFLERSNLPVRLLEIDSEDQSQISALDLGRYDAFLCLCNPVSFEVIQARGVPSVYVDFLLWMHFAPPATHFYADLYLAENYPGTTEWVERRGSEIPHLAVIPPLVQTIEWKKTEGTLLVGLGGMYSRLTVPGTNTNYVPYIVNQLLSCLDVGRFDKIFISGARGLSPLVEPIIERLPKVQFCSLSHHEFLNALAECEVFLSHPGLYAPFEAMLSGIPTGFLPPSNYTQVLQLRYFRSLGMADHSFSWDDLDREPIPSNLPEAEGVAAVLKEVAHAEHSAPVSQSLRLSMKSFLALTSRELEELGEKQRMAATVFRGEGPHLGARILEDWCVNLAERKGNCRVAFQ